MTVSPKLIQGAATSSTMPSDSILCFLPVRNELLRLPAVLDHHRLLGVDQFFVVDNGSTDGTTEFLSQQADVNLFSAEGSYTESHFALDWLHPLLDEFGGGRWVLMIDADELFVYPGHEQTRLRDFCKILDKRGAGAVSSILLDMYSDKPIAETSYAAGASLLGTCPYFDPGPYTVVRGALFPTFELRGGPRSRVFCGADNCTVPPTVSKVPLVKWNSSYRYVSSTHYMSGAPPLADLMGALLHFKFLSDFHERTIGEVARGEHVDHAREYKLYLKTLDESPTLRLHCSNSIRYQSSQQLSSLNLVGLLRGTAAFLGGAGIAQHRS